jgi:hypothetical protein
MQTRRSKLRVSTGAFVFTSKKGMLNDRLGQRPVLLLGIGLLAAGICGIAVSMPCC